MTEGSRYLKAPFAPPPETLWALGRERLEASERLMAVQIRALEQRLDRIEAGMERVERRLWIAVYGVAAAVLGEVARALMQILPG